MKGFLGNLCLLYMCVCVCVCVCVFSKIWNWSLYQKFLLDVSLWDELVFSMSLYIRGFFLFFKLNICLFMYLFIHLATLGLSSSMWDLVP